MRTWQLHEHLLGDHWVPTGEYVEADTFGVAAVRLFGRRTNRPIFGLDALRLDLQLGDGDPAWLTIQFDGDRYRLIPVDPAGPHAIAEHVEAHAARVLNHLRDEGIVQ